MLDHQEWKGTSLVAQTVKNLPASRRPGFNPWVGKIPWRSEWLPTPVFWPREFRVLYSPWGRKESDTAEQLSLHFRGCCMFNFCFWFFFLGYLPLILTPTQKKKGTAKPFCSVHTILHFCQQCMRIPISPHSYSCYYSFLKNIAILVYVR